MARTSHGGCNGGGSGCCGERPRRRPNVVARPARAAATGTAAGPHAAFAAVAAVPAGSQAASAAVAAGSQATFAAVGPVRAGPGAVARRQRAGPGPPAYRSTRHRADRGPDRRRVIRQRRLPARSVVRLIWVPGRRRHRRVVGQLRSRGALRRRSLASATRRRARRHEPSPRQLRRVLEPLAACVATLGPRQERVLVRRAGLRGFKGASREQTAERLHLTVRRVARLEHRALRTLRRKARAGACDAPQPAPAVAATLVSGSLPAPAAPTAAAPHQEVKAVHESGGCEPRRPRRKRAEAPQRGAGGRGRGRRAARAELRGRPSVPVRARRARDRPVRAAARARAPARARRGAPCGRGRRACRARAATSTSSNANVVERAR